MSESNWHVRALAYLQGAPYLYQTAHRLLAEALKERAELMEQLEKYKEKTDGVRTD